MLFSGIAASAVAAVTPGGGTEAVGGGARWKKIRELITRAIADTSKATIRTNLDEEGALTG